MKSFKLMLSGVAVAVSLLGCGGGGLGGSSSNDTKYVFNSVITFGDSISDPGAYKVGSIAALGGGKFTVNGANGKVWTEILATSVGAATQCAAQTGMLPNNGVTGAAVVNVAACNNYAQGSSRVTKVGSGPNGVALQAAPFNQSNLGLIADSIQNQISRHIAKAGGFGANDLVTVNGGGNDFFMQLNAVSAAAGGGATAAGAATIAGWSAAAVTAVTAGGAAATSTAGAAAVAAMGQAGGELASYIKASIVGKGAKYVVVRNLGDLNVTPLGGTFSADTKTLSSAMTTAFNAGLLNGLAGVAGIVYYDDYARSQLIAASPASFGVTNITTPTCGVNAFSQPGETVGTSLICNSTNLISGDTSRFAFADTVHPTPFAHQISSDYALALLRSAGLKL